MKTLALLCLLTATFGGGGDDDDPKQKPVLRMKSAVSVRGLDIKIGDLCEITPVNETTLAIAQTRFGRSPTGGYGRAVTRTDLVQTLVRAGVQLSTIKLTGSDEIVVQTINIDIPKQDMLDAATAALQATLSVEGGDVEFEPPVRVRSFKAPPGRASQELRARVRNAKTGASSAVVDVEILVDGEVFKKVPLTFRLQRYQKVLKTVGAVRRGAPLGPENVALVREPMAQRNGMYLTRIDRVTGMNAKRNLSVGQRLTLGDIEPPAVVRRGDLVTVVLTKGRVKVTAKAIANHDAPLEGRVTLTNPNSRTILTGTVYAPGLVVVQ